MTTQPAVAAIEKLMRDCLDDLPPARHPAPGAVLIRT